MRAEEAEAYASMAGAEKGRRNLSEAGSGAETGTAAVGGTKPEALRLMEDRPSQISVLPVVDAERCLGLVRLHDLYQTDLL